MIVPTLKATWLFELRTAPPGPKGFVVGVNSLSDSAAVAPISQRLRAGAVVGGWVCPALRNPLNNRVVSVGCERNKKAVVQLMQIRNGSLEFRVRQSFAPILDGDAVLISHDGRWPATGSPWVVLTSPTFRSPETVLVWEREFASTRTVSAPAGSAVSSSSDAGVVRARRSIDQLSTSPPNEWVRWAARNWSSDRQLFRATTVDMPGTPQEVWEYLRQLFMTSKFDVKDGDATGLFLVTTHQDLLGVKRMLYYVTLSADSPSATRTRVTLELFYFVGGKADANGAKVLEQDLVDILPRARP